MNDFIDVSSSFYEELVPVVCHLCEQKLNLSFFEFRRDRVTVVLLGVGQDVDAS